MGISWECPRCGRMNAPFNPSCSCKPEDCTTLVKSSDESSKHLTDAERYLNPDALYKIIESEKRKAEIAIGSMPNFYNAVKTKVNLPQFPCFICGRKHGAGFECATLSQNTLSPNGEFI